MNWNLRTYSYVETWQTPKCLPLLRVGVMYVYQIPSWIRHEQSDREELFSCSFQNNSLTDVLQVWEGCSRQSFYHQAALVACSLGVELFSGLADECERIILTQRGTEEMISEKHCSWKLMFHTHVVRRVKGKVFICVPSCLDQPSAELFLRDPQPLSAQVQDP